jgi:hypothetical protein
MNKFFSDLTDSAEQDTATDSKIPAVVEKFVIRLPNGLRDQIRQLSEQNRRSMNSEIIMVLENHIRQKFLQQMVIADPDGDYDDQIAEPQALHTGQTVDELNRMLESLPREKKEALLELLG